MSETRCSPCVPVDTVAGASVKFKFPESMSSDPMSIHAHAASRVALDDSSAMPPLSVRTRRRIAFADMSETAARGSVVDLTLCDPRGRFTVSSLEFSISMAFDGCGVQSR